MKKLLRKLRNQHGFSFLEAMIALAIMGVVTTSIMKVYINQHKNYMIQDDISTIQQNSRASIDELTRQIRMAAYGLPVGLQAITPSNTNPDTITITYANAGCDTYLSSSMPQPSAELKCGSAVDCFYDGQWIYIYEPDSALGEWFEITQVQTGSNHIQHNTMVLSRKYGKNALVLNLIQAKFYIDNTTDPNHPNLMVQYAGKLPQVYAEDITDLQFQYVMKNGAVEDEPTLIDNIREVRISINGRSANPDPDRPHDDQYRNRTYASTVYVRNIGF